MTLAGIHAVITGGGTGIGAAIARALADDGANLALLGRREAVLHEAATALPGAHVEVADVTDAASVIAAFAGARRVHGPIGILINNAGAVATAPFGRTTSEIWRAAMAVNLDGAFHCMQAALPDLKAAAAGRIVTIASTAGLKGYAYTSAYVAAKHGVIGLTRALAVELASTSVTVNAVCPGFTDTAIVDEAIERIEQATGQDGRAALARFNPQGRLIEPSEVAAAVRWLCLPENRSVTGQAIAVAGGEVM